MFIRISASTGTNLKALLKAIIQKATSRQDGIDDEDEEVTTQKRGVKLLNYDLQLLADYVSERQLEQVAIAVGDTEAFDSDLLSDLIESLGYWHDRIHIVLLLSVATSASSLQQRLSRAAVTCTKGQLFDVAPSDAQIEGVVETVITDSSITWPGADLMNLVLERQSDYIQSIDGLPLSLKYAHMSHYYANALTVFLIPDIKFADIPSDHFDALRNVDSFRQHCRHLLDNGQGSQVRDLLESNSVLFTLARHKIRELQTRLDGMMPVINLLYQIQGTLQGYSTLPTRYLSKLYKLAMSGRLTSDASLIRSMLLAIRKSQPEIIGFVFLVCSTGFIRDPYMSRFVTVRRDINRLIGQAAEENQELHSADHVQNSTLRTTIVAQKVELSKQKATLSKRDEAYTKLLRQFSDLLEEYFTASLIDPKAFPFHELVVYDLRSPYRETFTPRPRQAIERALAAPHDYLDCDCCAPDGADGNGEATLSASQPATAVLYQLYLESGSLINVSDLRQAFLAVLGDEGRSEDENIALFQRALAELKCLGFVKGTRKRVGHVAKVAWRGL